MKINLQNYEEWMVDYIEGNLSAEQQKELQEFLVFHPELQKELDAFGLTKISADTSVVFENKESLKREPAAGRVITMFSWVRYASVAAAACAIFIGVRFFGGADEQNGIQPYAFDKLHMKVPMQTTTPPSNTDVLVNEVVDTVKKYTQPEENQFAQTPQQDKREINPIQQIEIQRSRGFEDFAQADLRDKLSLEAQSEASTLAARGTVLQNSTVISLNDNKTVVDWWNDAVAIGGEMNAVVSEVKDAELNPFKRKETVQEGVKTRSFSVPGIEYYSRQSNQ